MDRERERSLWFAVCGLGIGFNTWLAIECPLSMLRLVAIVCIGSLVGMMISRIR